MSSKLTFRAVAEVVGLLSGAFSMIYISRVLGPEYLGFNATAAALIMLIGRLADGGLSALSAQRLARDDDSVVSLIALTLPAKVLASVVLVGCSLLVISILDIDARLRFFLFVTSGTIIFDACNPGWVFAALGRINTASLIRVGVSVLYLLVTVAVIRKPDQWRNLAYLSIFNSVANLIGSLYFFRYIKAHAFRGFKIEHGYVARIADCYKEAFHFLKGDLSSYVYTTSDRLILYYFTNSHTVGIYEAAYKVINPFYAINSVITPTMFRELAQSFKQGNVFPVMARYLFIMSLLTIPLGFFLLFFSADVVHILYGAKFIDSVPSLKVLGFVITFGFTSGIIVQPFSAWNMAREYGSSIFWGNVLNTFFNFTLIPFMGALGAALATVAAKVIVTIVGYLYFIRVVDYPIVKDFLCFFGASIVPLLIVYVLSFVSDNNIVLAMIYGVLYLAIISVMYRYYFKINRRDG